MSVALRIVIGADHRGYAMKEWLKANLSISSKDIDWIDVGAYSDERSDYPEFAIAAVKPMREDKADYGVLICGTGVGMAITANRFAGMYAGVVWNTAVARVSKEDDNTNIVVLPSDFVSNEQAVEMVQTWLGAEFKKGRYQQRLDMIDAIKR